MSKWDKLLAKISMLLRNCGLMNYAKYWKAMDMR